MGLLFILWLPLTTAFMAVAFVVSLGLAGAPARPGPVPVAPAGLSEGEQASNIA